jgi:hypothetical protein
VFLQEGRGDVVVDLALGGGAHDVGLVLAPGHQDDAAGVHDRADAHRQRVAWRAGVAAEVAGGVAARERVERDQARERVRRAARLVEADVAGAADAEDLEVDAAGGRDLVPRRRHQCASTSAFGARCPREVDAAGGMSRWSKSCSCMNRQ